MPNNDSRISLINSGDERSFDRLFSEYYPSLLSVAVHMTGDETAARDIVQDIFARLWAGWKYSHIKSPKDFLFIAVRNHTISYLRSRQTAYTHRDRIVYEERFRAGLVEEETYLLLTDAIDRLPPRTGDVIKLSIEGMSQEKIAKKMGIAVATVKSLKADGIKKLRRMLGPLAIILLCGI